MRVLADDITVIRDSKTIETFTRAWTTSPETGSSGAWWAGNFRPLPQAAGRTVGEVCMRSKDWTYHPIYREVVDNVLPLARAKWSHSGWMGARHRLAGLFGHSYGTWLVKLNGKEVTLKKEKDAIRHGLAYGHGGPENGLIL